MCRQVAWPLLVVLLWPCAVLAQGRLEQLRREVSAPSSDDSNDKDRSKDRDRGSSSSSNCSGGDDDCGLGALFLPALLAPFSVPCALCGDEWKMDGYFQPYPYAEAPGYMWLGGGGGSGPRSEDLRVWAGRLSIEDGNNFRDLNRVGGELFLDTTLRVGVRTSWHNYTERLPCGCWDDLVLGDTNLVVRFAQHERVQMYAGFGFRVLADAQTHWGVNFTYGGDFYPIRPVVVSTVLDLGTLGSAGVVHARGTVGWLHGRWEFYAGYDFLRVGSLNLQGPLAGVRLWF